MTPKEINDLKKEHNALQEQAMNRDDIIRMASEAGATVSNFNGRFVMYLDDIERFFDLAQAAEREACAQIAWNMETDENGPIETAIRARGEK